MPELSKGVSKINRTFRRCRKSAKYNGLCVEYHTQKFLYVEIIVPNQAGRHSADFSWPLIEASLGALIANCRSRSSYPGWRRDDTIIICDSTRGQIALSFVFGSPVLKC